MPTTAAKTTKPSPPLTASRPAEDLPEPVGAGALPEPEPELDAAALVGPAVATAPTPPVTAPVLETCGAAVPRAFAAAWKLSKVLPLEGALMAPTIPAAQCPTNLQKNQTGLVLSVICTVN